MKITTAPGTRFGWTGQTLQYVVKADGAAEVSAPAQGRDGLRVRVVDTRPVGDGVEARVEIESVGGAFFCDAVPLNVRDSAGSVSQARVGVAIAPPAVMPVAGVVGALALVGAVMAIRWGGWAGWALGILAAIMALAGIGVFGFMVWGRYAGFPWGFAG